MIFRKTILMAAAFFSFGLTAHAKDPIAKADKEMKSVLDELQKKQPKPIEKLTAAEARKQPTPTDAVMARMTEESLKPDTSVSTQDIKISGASGELPARLYRPEGSVDVRPLVVYFHGGGWVIADKDVYDSSARALAKQSGAIVLSVDYRQGPENKFPAAHDDAYASYKWAVQHASELKADPKNIAVAGESAGGNLAINVAIKARDEKFQLPVHELLVYPVASSNMNSTSYQENANAKPLNKPMMEWFMKNYLQSSDQASDTRINVVEANLKGLPETTIITAQIDPLMSEGKQLADKLKTAGVKVNYKNYNGVTHEFFGMAPVVSESMNAQKFASAELKDAFKK